MDQPALRQLIQRKLSDGRLPLTGLFRAEVGPQEEAPCDACSFVVPADQVLVEVAGQSGVAVRFHSDCFTIWKAEVEAAN
jgi:hypothetical protein